MCASNTGRYLVDSFTTSRNSVPYDKKVATSGGRHQELPRERQEMFPCLNPTNPNHAEFDRRIRTFQSWPGHINAKPDQLAEAGFFFLGERDRCKCYYCNGGLQNWEKDDDPWLEHAKWFPDCEYVLQQKGPEYVSSINSAFQNLKRPGNQLPNASQDISPNFMPHETLHTKPRVGGSGLTHLQQNITKSNRETEELHHEIELCRQLEGFGFPKNLIDCVLQKKHQENGRFASLTEMMDAVQRHEQELQKHNEYNLNTYGTMLQCDDCIPSQHVPEITQNVADKGHHMEIELQSALDQVNCVMCMRNERCCVFTSCGHLCCCMQCGESLRDCPICKTRIASAIRVYKT